ncbi:MAG: HNH endonuclease family protein, partial [Actinomycetota bacterium]|nr:HNH endonuclease family protein [Actinomycetota bacterium]
MQDAPPSPRSALTTAWRALAVAYAAVVVLLAVVGLAVGGLGGGLVLLGCGVVPGALVLLATARTRLSLWRSLRGAVGVLVGGVTVLVVGALLAPGVTPGPPAATPPPGVPTSAQTGSAPASSDETPPAVAADPTAATALDLLGTLPVKGRAPSTGYARALFGQAWSDTDRNGCDTRNDILTRDLVDRAYKTGTHDCVVVSGALLDPYTGRSIGFVRGATSSEAVQVDHVVALGDAWQTGAASWSVVDRELFANDPLNLLAVDGPTNLAKGDGDAATWLPPSRASRCGYVARQVAVKARYGAWVTPAEKAAVQRVLTDCPSEPAPAGGTSSQQRQA